MIDDSGFYVPPQREREYTNEGPKLLLNWMPELPADSPCAGTPTDEGDEILIASQITGIVRRNHIVPTPKNKYKAEKRVADVELVMPDTQWHSKIVTLWCDHEMLDDCLAWLEAEHGDDALVSIRHMGKEKRRHLYGIRVHDGADSAPQAAKQAGGKPTTASAWTALYHEKVAEGKSNTVLQRIIDTATADEFVWDGQEFISLLADNAGPPPDPFDDDLPF